MAPFLAQANGISLNYGGESSINKFKKFFYGSIFFPHKKVFLTKFFYFFIFY